MDIFKAVDLLNKGEKIRDVKSPLGVFLEKRNGKIVSSQGREGIDLNTDAEYEIYKEKEPDFINKISILLEDLRQYTQEKCTYDCKKCKLHINNECIKDKIDSITNIKYKGYDIGKIKPTIHTGIKDIEEDGYRFIGSTKPPEIIEITFPLSEHNKEETMKRITDELTKMGFKMRGF